MIPTESDAERMQRLASVWRASAPTASEIAALRSRFARRAARPRRSRARVLLVALVQGLTLGGGTLAAAAWVAGTALPRIEHALAGAATTPAPSRAPTPERATSHDTHGAVGSQAVPMAAFEDLASSPAMVEAEGIATSGATASRATQPSSAGERSRGVKNAAGGGRYGAQSPSSAAVPTVEPESPGPTSETPVAGPWARVAQALSAHDWARADDALGNLASSMDPATRDAADLARAELRIAHGGGAALRSDVQRLAQAGATALIRKRAAALLQRLP